MANQLLNAMDGLGHPMRLDSYHTKRRLVDAGFVDIEEQVIRLPLNARLVEAPRRDLGRCFNLDIQQACQPLSLAPLSRRHYTWTPDEIHDLFRKDRVEVYGNTVDACCILQVPIQSVWGRTPLTGPKIFSQPESHAQRVSGWLPGARSTPQTAPQTTPLDLSLEIPSIPR